MLNFMGGRSLRLSIGTSDELVIDQATFRQISFLYEKAKLRREPLALSHRIIHLADLLEIDGYLNESTRFFGLDASTVALKARHAAMTETRPGGGN